MNRRRITLLITALVFLALYSTGGFFFNNFLTLRVLVNLLGDNAFVGIAAIGMTFAIISGGIDLSVASVIAFTTIFVAQTVEGGMHPVASMGCALVLGALFGAAQGWLVSVFELPPFLVTLSGMFFARGMGFMINDCRVRQRAATLGRTGKHRRVPSKKGSTWYRCS